LDRGQVIPFADPWRLPQPAKKKALAAAKAPGAWDRVTA
jgi:hypothetical protein